MIFSLTCTATDTAPDAAILGYLLHKHPDKWFTKPLTFGTASVYYPEASPERTTAILAVRIDPVAVVRSGSKSGKTKFSPTAPATLAEYVSDRPYAASSFLSVAIAEVFGTALGGRCEKFPEAVDTPLALTAVVYALACDGGAAAIRRVWEPLGYTVSVDAAPELLDDRFPQWGAANLFTVTLCGTVTVRDLLAHLYVLVPVLDNAKHYFVAEDEVEKLLRRGGDWLSAHPAKEYITARYLRYRRTLTDAALLRLSEVAEVSPEPDAAPEPAPVIERKTRLNDARIVAALEAVRAAPFPVKRVLDLGCGEGKTLSALREAFPALDNLTGMDVSPLVLTRASRRLKLDRQEGDTKRIELLHGSLVYHDVRLQGFDVVLLMEVNSTKPALDDVRYGSFDVALLMEVLEHIDPERLPDVERNVFGYIRPRRLIITTPNAEYNTVWESLPGGEFRHTDHRFEWTRAQFEEWGSGVATSYGYSMIFSGVGDEDPQGRGTPTQMAVFDVERG